MELTVGAVLQGTVKSITNFGAFISLPDNRTGLVHISEVANAFVSDIRQHLTEGQTVKVQVIAVDPSGKVNLSIKRLEPKQPQNRSGANRSRSPRPAAPEQAAPKSQDQIFEERLKQFMSESDSKISSIRQYSDHKTRNRRR